MICPKCGKEMEHGYLQIGSSVALGVFWFDRLFEHGEQFLAKKNRILNAPIPRNIEGFRCPKCKVVLFEYGKKNREEGKENGDDRRKYERLEHSNRFKTRTDN